VKLSMAISLGMLQLTPWCCLAPGLRPLGPILRLGITCLLLGLFLRGTKPNLQEKLSFSRA